jgi:G3E family GTPase
MAALNIDASLIKRDSVLSQTKENLVEMSNGCICCTLREDLLVEVKKLCESGDFDGLIIESTGIAEPMPIAQTFVYQDEESGIDLTKYAFIDTMVTVVDATTFLDYINHEDTIVDKHWTDDQEDQR